MTARGRSSLLLLACVCAMPLWAHAEDGASATADAVPALPATQETVAESVPDGTSAVAEPAASTVLAQAALGKDVDRLIAIFDSQDPDAVDEALVQLRWAGITDPRLYEHLMNALREGKVQRASMRERYIEALGYAGNPAVYSAMRELLADARLKGGDRDDLEDALALELRYTEIAAAMAVDMAQVNSVETL